MNAPSTTVPTEPSLWERVRSGHRDLDDPYYGIMRTGGDEMAALRALFPEGEADDMNLVLFSTSGVHGSYCTIEAAEEEPALGVTFLVIQPRIVGMRYGNCHPRTPEDFAFLKQLRESSHRAFATIGAPPRAAAPAAPAAEQADIKAQLQQQFNAGREFEAERLAAMPKQAIDTDLVAALEERRNSLQELVTEMQARDGDRRKAAESVATMVTEWVDGAHRLDTDWRAGLADVIERRLARFAPAGAPAGFALVPLRMTRAIIDAVQDEEWQWEDMLAAAQAIDEPTYEDLQQPFRDKLIETLEAAGSGLQWYREAYPDADSGADDEMAADIQTCLAQLNARAAIEPTPGSLPRWTIQRVNDHSIQLRCPYFTTPLDLNIADLSREHRALYNLAVDALERSPAPFVIVEDALLATRELVERVQASGMTVQIEQRPLLPRAQGNVETVFSVRPRLDRGEGKLWCIHIPGPGEIHAMPDRFTADRCAWGSNRAIATWLAKKQEGQSPEQIAAWPSLGSVTAVVHEWPGSAEEHAEALLQYRAEDWRIA